jgi:hypothetical protein
MNELEKTIAILMNMLNPSNPKHFWMRRRVGTLRGCNEIITQCRDLKWMDDDDVLYGARDIIKKMISLIMKKEAAERKAAAAYEESRRNLKVTKQPLTNPMAEKLARIVVYGE